MLPFQKSPKIDAHVHLNASSPIIQKLAVDYNFKLLTINTEVPEFPSIYKQQELANQNNSGRSTTVFYATTILTTDIFKRNWATRVLKKIETDISNGACGVKFWKNIGMSIQRPDGSFLMLNDHELKPVFNFLEREEIPVLGHQGEPRNCWLPLDEMTVKSDREYFSSHPQYHMYKHAQYPDYWEHIKARDAVLDRHPDLNFVGLHLGSIEWDLDRLAERLVKFPEFNVDLAERFSHLYYHASKNRDKVKRFFETFQKRIIYGTDIIVDPEKEENEIAENLRNRWEKHWNFLSTGKELKSKEISESFRGLNLSASILEKIYFQNALRIYNLRDSRSTLKGQVIIL